MIDCTRLYIMSIHAILGATGGTGSAILRYLLSSQIPGLHINILVRSKSKLLNVFPQLESASSATITIFEAPISNESAVQACLKGASTIYACVATNHAVAMSTLPLQRQHVLPQLSVNSVKTRDPSIRHRPLC